MKHFSLTEWADFVRGMIDIDRKEAMQVHLDSGCKECGEVAKTWARVCEAAKRECAYQPPESAVRMAKSHLAIYGNPGRAPKVELLFDSCQNPVIAGVRATATAARQMLYGIGTYRIDIRMEPQMDSDKVSVVGQILNSADQVRAGAHVTVALLRGNKILAESQTNTLGEFHLECSLEGHLQLLLTLPRARDIRIPLLVPTESAMTGHLEPSDSEIVKWKRLGKRDSTRKRV
jgi:hypothetical protein